jgi:hypothetical protein
MAHGLTQTVGIMTDCPLRISQCFQGIVPKKSARSEFSENISSREYFPVPPCQRSRDNESIGKEVKSHENTKFNAGCPCPFGLSTAQLFDAYNF